LHSSAMRIGTKFLKNYFNDDMTSILEIGSYDVNGSLRSAQPIGSQWVGIDIEEGPGVDIVLNPSDEIPFPEGHFDVVVATSVFEHDPEFWKTLEKMARAAKPTGFLFICAPSNGPVHRYPLDCFRFYPDASQSFLKIIQEVSPGARLQESFIGAQDHEGLWNDFVAIYSMGKSKNEKIEKVFLTETCSNVWDGELFLEETFIEFPEDRINANSYSEQRDALATERDALATERDAILRTISWRWTSPIRYLRQIFARSVRFGRSLVRKV